MDIASIYEGAGAKKELINVNPEIASIYVGETSRTIQERALEHWADTKGTKGVEGSHMLKHMEQYHGREKPKFIMRVVQLHRSALSRQTGEEVQIMRRGGAGSVLNSKSEFNRCYIPRLKVEEQDKIRTMEQQEEDEMKAISTTLRKKDEVWERRKNVKKTGGTFTTGSSTKRGSQNERNQGRRKRLKYEVLGEDWGVQKSTSDPGEEGATRDTGQVPVLPTIEGGAVLNVLKDGTGQHHVLHSTITGAVGSTNDPSPPEGADV